MRAQYSIPKEWGLKMNGSTQYVTVPDNNALDLTTTITISMWVKRNSTGKTFLMSKGTNGYGVYFDPTDRLTLTKVNTLDFLNQKGKIVDSLWHHVVLLFDNSIAEIHIDGKLNNIANVGSAFAGTATNLFIGQDSSGAFFFNGSMKDVRIYNAHLSPTQIEQLYNLKPGSSFLPGNLVGWYKMDEGTGTTITDSSSTANNGTITGRVLTGNTPTTLWNIDPVRPRRRATSGQTVSISTNGTTSSGTISHNAAYNFGTGNFSLEFKVNTRRLVGTSTLEYIINKQGGGVAAGFFLYRNATLTVIPKNKINFIIFDGTNYFAVAVPIEKHRQWAHVLISADRSSVEGYKMFVNGVLSPIYEGTAGYTSIGSISNALNINIGTDSAGTNDYDGNFYDLRIYNVALTDDQCLSRYYENASITTGLVGWYKMDENSGTTITDSSSTANNGTVANITWAANSMDKNRAQIT